MDLKRYRRLVFSVVTVGILLVGVFLLLNGGLHLARAAPVELFVTPTGAGTECSQTTPCSLQTALAQATDGDTLYLAQGTYTGTGAAVITISKPITLYGGWDGASTGPVMRDPDLYSTILDGEGQRRVVSVAGALTTTLDGLCVTNGYVNGDNGAGIKVINAYLTLRNCQVYNNTADGSGGWIGGVYVGSDSVLLENNRIFENSGSGIGLSSSRDVIVRGNVVYSNTAVNGGAGIQVQNGQWITMTDNIIYSNTVTSGGGGGCWFQGGHDLTFSGNTVCSNTASNGGGLHAFKTYTLTIAANIFRRNATSGNGSGLFLYQGGNLLMRNNVLIENEAQGVGSGVDLYANTVHMVHNTLARNGGTHGQGVYLAGDARLWMTNTILVSQTVGIEVGWGAAHMEGTLWGSGAWANVTDWVNNDTLVTGTVNIWGDPAFVDPDNADYHLSSGSAAIDAGVDAGVTDDIDGDARPSGAGYDIGADEFLLPSTYLPLVMRSFP